MELGHLDGVYDYCQRIAFYLQLSPQSFQLLILEGNKKKKYTHKWQNDLQKHESEACAWRID